MSRHPFSKYWKAPVAFLLAAVAAFAVLIWTHSYVLALGTILVAAIGYGVYALGESSDLPGTAGKNDKNVRT
jgi:hypothetical protein